MPPVVAAASVAVAKAAASFTLSKFLVSTAISLALNAAGSAFFGKKPKSQGNTGSLNNGVQDVVRSSIASHRLIYGEFRVGGVMVFASTGGSNNKYLHMVIVLASHACEAVTDIWLDDEKLGPLSSSGWVQSGTFSGSVRVNIHLGADDQEADEDLVNEVSEWTEAHRLRGHTYAYLKMVYDAKVFPNGIPTPKFLVKGKNDIYDPRNYTSGWSDNWALCVADFMKTEYAVGLTDDEVDNDNLIEQANICDEQVYISGTKTQARYNLNGVIDTQDETLTTLDNMMTAAAALPVWSNGKYYLYVGSYRTPEVVLGESDFIANNFRVSPHLPRKEQFNRVKGVFNNPENSWQPSEFPPIENAVYVTADNGEVLNEEIELPFTTDSMRAQRIGKIHLERSRQGMTIEATANLKALALKVGETVAVNLPQFGFDNKVFITTKWAEADNGVDLVLQEEAATVYDWNFGQHTLYDPAPNTDLPDPRHVSAPTALNVSTKAFLENGASFSRVLIQWTSPDDAYVTEGGSIEFQFKKSSEPTWEPSWSVDGKITQTSTPALEPLEFYDFRMRSVSRLRVPSSWQTVTNYAIGSAAAGVTGNEDRGSITEAHSVSDDFGSINDVVTSIDDFGFIT